MFINILLNNKLIFTTKLIVNRAEFPALTIMKLFNFLSVNIGLTKGEKAQHSKSKNNMYCIISVFFLFVQVF